MGENQRFELTVPIGAFWVHTRLCLKAPKNFRVPLAPKLADRVGGSIVGVGVRAPHVSPPTPPRALFPCRGLGPATAEQPQNASFCILQ